MHPYLTDARSLHLAEAVEKVEKSIKPKFIQKRRRRYYATIHAQLGTPIHVIEKLLNHVSGSFGGVAGIYNRFQYQDEMHHAVDSYEKFIQSLIRSG